MLFHFADLRDQHRLMKTLFPHFLAAMITVAVLGLLAGSGCTPKAPEHGTAFLVEADLSGLMLPDTPEVAMAHTRQTLQKRLDKLGVRPFIEPVGTNRLQIKVRPLSMELLKATRFQFVMGSAIEFGLVHEENASLARDGIVPAGYEPKRKTVVLPNGEKRVIPVMVQKDAVPGCSARHINSAYVTRGSKGQPHVELKFDEEGKRALAELTATNIGRQLAILLDGECVSAPVIRSAITSGRCVIQGTFSAKEASDLATFFDSPLETPVRLLTETSF